MPYDVQSSSLLFVSIAKYIASVIYSNAVSTLQDLGLRLLAIALAASDSYCNTAYGLQYIKTADENLSLFNCIYTIVEFALRLYDISQV